MSDILHITDHDERGRTTTYALTLLDEDLSVLFEPLFRGECDG